MLDTVIYARDKWLTPGGLMFPDRARIYVAAFEDFKYKRKKFAFWTNVYGIDMSTMRDMALTEPVIETVTPDRLISTLCPIYEINLLTVKTSDIPFVTEYQLKVNRNDHLHGLVSWFEVGFVHCLKPLTLTTSPKFRPTHWK
jgi:protein arginine N-methyltransferase 1